jgi:hypothetical protein
MADLMAITEAHTGTGIAGIGDLTAGHPGETNALGNGLKSFRGVAGVRPRQPIECCAYSCANGLIVFLPFLLELRLVLLEIRYAPRDVGSL